MQELIDEESYSKKLAHIIILAERLQEAASLADKIEKDINHIDMLCPMELGPIRGSLYNLFRLLNPNQTEKI
jgi:hypothetical protein